MIVHIRLPADQLRAGQVVKIDLFENPKEVKQVIPMGDDPPMIRLAWLDVSYTYSHYSYSVLSLEQWLQVATDPRQRLAIQILMEDPMALDAATDILGGVRC